MNHIKLLTFLISFSVYSKNTLTLYNTPSPYGLNWSTPSTLAKDAAINFMASKLLPFWHHKRYIGHVNVELNCNGEQYFTGMTAKNMNALGKLIKGMGLGILYHSFKGQLEPEETKEEIMKYLEEGEANFLRYKISQENCQNLVKYLNEYRAGNIGRYYGLVHRPLHGEGAGCSAFGASFIEVAGLMKQEYKNKWSNIVNIPMEFTGPPVNNKEVSLLTLLFSSINWAKENEEHKTLFYWSPDLMYEWVKKKTEKPDTRMSVLKIGKSSGIVIDARDAQFSSRIWKKDQAYEMTHKPQSYEPDLNLKQNF